MTGGRQIVRGLQVERTQLAWERSTTGLLAASVVLVVHPDRLGSARLVLAGLALLMAATMGVVGRLRVRQVARARKADPRPTGSIPAAGHIAAGLCCAVVVFAGATIFVMAV